MQVFHNVDIMVRMIGYADKNRIRLSQKSRTASFIRVTAVTKFDTTLFYSIIDFY
jgi:hypothetical protein